MRTDPLQKGAESNVALPDQSVKEILNKNGGVPLSVNQVKDHLKDKYSSNSRVGPKKSYDAMTQNEKATHDLIL